MLTDPGRVPLGRRAWIGDGRHGASVAPDGTIDWYAPGGLTAAPALWRLLDPAGAAVRVGARRDGPAARRHLPASRLKYRPGTNVAETLVEGPAGRRVLVVDFMPWPGPGRDAPGGIVRLVRALAGPVEVEVEVLAGHRHGARREVARSAAGVRLGGLEVAAPTPFEPGAWGRDEERWRAALQLDAGEEAVVTVGGDQPLSRERARRLLEETEEAWRSWRAPVAYDGPYREAVERALLSVRVLTGPGGAPAGAGTTSLPRRVGSERSSDDRWVRLRDVARAVPALASAGLVEDAEAAEAWLRRAVTDADVPWPAWLDADGQPVPPAEELPLAGWRRAQPVRAGRTGPTDLGLVGDVVAAVGASMGGPGGRRDDPGPLSAASDPLAAATDWAADHWRRPDGGPWQIERPLRLYTRGRVSAWSALDRMARMAQQANPLDLRAAAWYAERGDLLSWLEAEAIAADGGLKMDASPGAPDEADASLVTVAWDGPWPAGHPLVGATVDRVLERLSSEGLVHRYSDRVADERSGPDLPDLEASLLTVRALAALRRWDEAHDRMEAVTGLVDRAGAGLIAETADPVSGELFGNFPFTSAALALVEAAFLLVRGPR